MTIFANVLSTLAWLPRLAAAAPVLALRWLATDEPEAELAQDRWALGREALEQAAAL